MLKIAGSAALAFIIFRLVHPEPLDSLGVLIKILLVAAFVITLVVLKVIDSREIEEVKLNIQRFFTRPSGLKSTEEPS